MTQQVTDEDLERVVELAQELSKILSETVPFKRSDILSALLVIVGMQTGAECAQKNHADFETLVKYSRVFLQLGYDFGYKLQQERDQAIQ